MWLVLGYNLMLLLPLVTIPFIDRVQLLYRDGALARSGLVTTEPIILP